MIQQTTKRYGGGVIFYDQSANRALVFRRDNKPTIEFPDCLDIIGGSAEDGEAPLDAQLREVSEELLDKRTNMPLQIETPKLFKVMFDPDRNIEQHIYWTKATFTIEDVTLLEGQYLVWVSEADIESQRFGYGYKQVVKDFLLQQKEGDRASV